MVVKFDNESLQELYESGKTADKQYRFRPDVVKQYQVRINVLEKAAKEDDLYAIRSLNYELLKGNNKGSSIRVNEKYRIVLKISQVATETVAKVGNILE
jgi:proteic killer suppression protein